MAHFKLIAVDEIFLSDNHVCFGVSAGNTATFLLSKTAAAVLDSERPAGRKFTANMKHNSKWLDKFHQHTDGDPDFVTFAKGRKSNRWYAHAAYL